MADAGKLVHEATIRGFQLGRMAQRDGNADDLEATLLVGVDVALRYAEQRLAVLGATMRDQTASRLRTKRTIYG